MNKRITSLLLCFVMVFTMLAAAVPALAMSTEAPITVTIDPDKTTASPGDKITYTVNVGPIKRLQSVNFTLVIPEGLTYVSGKEVDGLKALLGADKAEYTDSTKTMVVSGGGSYNSDGTTALMQFSCTVNAGTEGTTLKITFEGDEDFSDDAYKTYDTTYNFDSSEVTITAAPKPATSITLNKTAATIYTGSDETLIATVEPADTTDTVTWESSDTAVATVDTNGKVTAVAPGTATITAKAGSQSASCVVTVENAPCTHTNKTNVDAKTSTCKEQGWEAHSKCNDCGQLFDKDGNEISAIPYLSLAAHKYTANEKKPEALKTAGTCKDKAIYLHSCEVCGKVAPSEAWGTFYGDLDPNNHAGGTYLQNQKDASCKEEGYTGDKHCSVCDAKLESGSVINKSSHTPAKTWSYDSEYHWKECTNAAACGEKLEKATHNFVWVVDTHATEESAGSKHEECVCGKTQSEGTVIPKLDHTHVWVETKAKPSTCKEEGNNQYFYCTNCKKYYKADKVKETTVAAETLPLAKHTAVAHAAVEATCAKEGNIAYWTCSVCEKYFSNAECTTEIKKEDTVEAKKSHVYDESKWVSNATNHWHACTVCGDKKDVAAHTYGTDNKCTVCGYAKPAGGGYIPPVQKPTIDAGEGVKVTLSADGTVATITVDPAYELADVVLNGTSKGKVTEVKGLKTGDKLVVTATKKATEPTKEDILATLADQKLVARSKVVTMKNGKKAVRITWYNQNGEMMEFDGVQIYRSTKKNFGYGKKPIFTSETDKYYNTAVKAGTKYYYKVRGFVVIDGQKYYTDWSLKAIRTVK